MRKKQTTAGRKRNLAREERTEREGGRNGKTGITALHCPAANPPSASHKTTFDTFQCLGPTLASYSHTLRVTQTYTTRKEHIHTSADSKPPPTPPAPPAPLRPLCFSDSMKSAPSSEVGGGLSSVAPLPPLPPRFHPFSMAPPSFKGPIRPFVLIDRLWQACKWGYTECSVAP